MKVKPLPEENYEAMKEGLASLCLMNKPNVTTLYLIRHGQDELPRKANNYDQPLSSLGIANAHKAGEKLAGYGITQLASSPSLRASQTADIIGSYSGLTNQVMDDLRDIKPTEDFASYARGLLAVNEIWRKNQESILKRFTKLFWPAMTGFESRQAFRTRTINTIDSILEKYPGQNIAVVSHCGYINAYISEMLGLDADAFFFIHSTGISIVRAYEEYRILISLNDASHI